MAGSGQQDPLAPFRSELRAHCYRMLGSLQDAEDVLQEVSVRVWRGRAGFEGRSSLRTWMHRIAINACLNELERKERRVLPMDVFGAAGPDEAMREPAGEFLWIQPYPDDPELSAVGKESVELAFICALQRLAANQRAAVILFDVLGFSAAEIAVMMATTPASVRAALQRARKVLADRCQDEPSQQVALARLGEQGQRELVARYTAALRAHDVEGMLALVTADATWAMPPLMNWFHGRDAIAGFLAAAPFHVDWRHCAAMANGQLAVGCYAWSKSAGAHVAYALDVLTIRGDQITAIVSFIDGSLLPVHGLPPSIHR
ncbi:RNA polymerase subunit sigma-70 [Nakamurella sp. GG22]